MKEEKVKVLIVDDEPMILDLLGNYLEFSDFQTEKANDGKECLETAKLFKPDLILLDFSMPGMSGLDVLKAIKQEESDIAVIMVTGVGDLDMAIQCMKAGAYDFLEKPVKLKQLGISINNALEKRSLIIGKKRLTMELKIKNEKLEKTLKEIKTLKGLIPICANCKKIYNDKGDWEVLETYLRNHSEAEFSHDICHDCTKELYPDS